MTGVPSELIGSARPRVRHNTDARQDLRSDPESRPVSASKLVAQLGSALLGLSVGMAIALGLGVLLVPAFVSGICLLLGIGCLAPYSLDLSDRKTRIERSAFRPVTFILAALGFLAVDLGIIWLIMQVAWR